MRSYGICDVALEPEFIKWLDIPVIGDIIDIGRGFFVTKVRIRGPIEDPVAPDAIDWFHLKNAVARNAGLLHLTFDAPCSDPKRPLLHLLASSIIDPAGLNAVISVRLDERHQRIETMETSVFPTQASAGHRVFALEGALFATEFASNLAWIQRGSRTDLVPRVDETSDFYATFGLGTRESDLRYPS